MKAFAYSRAADPAQAIAAFGQRAHSKFLGGGTNLVDLMKMGVETPEHLVDLNRLALAQITEIPNGGGVRLGALARNAETAEHPLIRERYPVLREAILAGASPQLRNRATTGGNLLQRTRCPYFYDPEFPACNKRKTGSGCGAVQGFNRSHAIFGQSDQCIATHPSDMCVALAVLEPVVRVQGPQGERAIPFADFHRLPGETPEQDTNLAPGELIVAVDLPAIPWATRSHYLKIRDRASYAFALVSMAVALHVEGGVIQAARIALGGVAHRPWRAREAEAALQGKAPDPAIFQQAAQAALAAAKGYEHNQFKIELARRTIVRGLTFTAKA